MLVYPVGTFRGFDPGVYDIEFNPSSKTGSFRWRGIRVEPNRPTIVRDRPSDCPMIAICLDHSGSMSGTDLANAKANAKRTIDTVSSGTLVGIFAFDSTVSELVPFTEVTDANRASLKAQVDSLSSGGNTALWKAADTALDRMNALDPEHKNNASLLLLTDGQDNASGSITRSSVVAKCQAMGVAFNSISYGSRADAELGEASSATGGRNVPSTTSLSSLTAAFSQLLTYGACRDTIADDTGMTSSSGTWSDSFSVDSSIADLQTTITLSVPSSSATVWLVSPDGTRYAANSTMDAGGESAFVFFLTNPEMGNWTVSVSAASGSEVACYVDASANKEPPRLTVWTDETETTVYAQLTYGASVDGASVRALFQDGGVSREVRFEPIGAGIYKLELADCGAYGGGFTVRADAAQGVATYTYVGDEDDPDGNEGTAIPESFTRAEWVDRSARSLPEDGDLYVDGSRGMNSNDGKSWATAKKSIQAAIDAADAGYLIWVNNGRYEPIDSNGKQIEIRSVNGPQVTIIDASLQWSRGVTNRCATLGTWYSNGTIISGFRLINGIAERGGGVYYGKLRNCTLSGNSASECGGGSYYGTLNNCTVVGNTAESYGGGICYGALTGCAISGNYAQQGGGADDGTMTNCTVSGNTAEWGGGACGTDMYNCVVSGNTATDREGGGVDQGTLENCLLIGNSALYGGGASDATLNNCTVVGNSAVGSSYYSGGGGCEGCRLNNCIIWGNTALTGNGDTSSSFGVHSCSGDELVGFGNITDNPRFIDSANGNYHLESSSPCIDAGMRHWSESLGTDLDGNPRWRGQKIDMGAYESSGGTYNPNAYSAKTLYVDAWTGNDANSGESWASAMKSIQTAIEAAREGDTILVAPGTYSPIVTMNMRLSILAPGGSSVTRIDGGGKDRCATLSATYGDGTNTVMEGFCITNGYCYYGGFEYEGGGVCGGTLSNCEIVGNIAQWGGGALCGVLNNCILSGNTGSGGGACGSILNNCLIRGNRGNQGGGVDGCILRNCTLVENSANYYGGFEGDELYNCIVWGNTTTGGGSQGYGTVRYCCLDEEFSGEGNISANPLFVDAVNGDFRLSGNSPCINAGANSSVNTETDLAGYVRIWNGCVDMGAYEFGSMTPIRCTVTLDQQNGTGGASSTTAVFGSPMPAISIPTRAGYTFCGYYSQPDGGGTQYYTASGASMQTWNVMSSATLYAFWRRTPTLAEAVNATSLVFSTGGGAKWYGQFEESHDRVSAAQSGDIDDYGQSWVRTSVAGAGTISFWWRVSSESGYDSLSLEIDGKPVDKIDGERKWIRVTYTISSSGSHTIRWIYSKDGTVSKGTDCGWLDQVSWVPIPPFKVCFNANGGTLPKGKSMAAQKLAYGKAAALRKNTFVRTGYIFAGWALKKGGAIAYKNGQSVKNLRTDGKMTTLYAVWAKPKYKVAFYANGGTGTMAVQTFKYGTAGNLAACKFTAPKGKKFAGWATSAANAKAGKVKYKNKQAVKNLLLTGKTVKLYAVWKKK